MISKSTTSTACVSVRQASQNDARQQDRKQSVPSPGDTLREEFHDPGVLTSPEKLQGCRKGKEIML